MVLRVGNMGVASLSLPQPTCDLKLTRPNEVGYPENRPWEDRARKESHSIPWVGAPVMDPRARWWGHRVENFPSCGTIFCVQDSLALAPHGRMVSWA